MLIYSDPADDGYVRGPVYPDGPWRPPQVRVMLSKDVHSCVLLTLSEGNPAWFCAVLSNDLPRRPYDPRPPLYRGRRAPAAGQGEHSKDSRSAHLVCGRLCATAGALSTLFFARATLIPLHSN